MQSHYVIRENTLPTVNTAPKLLRSSLKRKHEMRDNRGSWRDKRATKEDMESTGYREWRYVPSPSRLEDVSRLWSTVWRCQSQDVSWVAMVIQDVLMPRERKHHHGYRSFKLFFFSKHFCAQKRTPHSKQETIALTHATTCCFNSYTKQHRDDKIRQDASLLLAP